MLYNSPMSDIYTKQVTSYEGRIIRVIQKHTTDGRIHETAVRPPGTRIIIHDTVKDQILLSQEIRLDIGQDLRLPGGKICDTNAQWDDIKDSPDLDKIIVKSAAEESRDETAINPLDLKVFSVSTTGAPTMKHDLYYLVTNKFEILPHQHLTEDGVISNVWMPIKEVVDACLTGQIREGRSAAVLLQYLHSMNKI